MFLHSFSLFFCGFVYTVTEIQCAESVFRHSLLVLTSAVHLFSPAVMSVGVPAYRLREQVCREKSKGIFVDLPDVYWQEVLHYMSTVVNPSRTFYKDTATWYIQKWNMCAGTCVLFHFELLVHRFRP